LVWFRMSAQMCLLTWFPTNPLSVLSAMGNHGFYRGQDTIAGADYKPASSLSQPVSWVLHVNKTPIQKYFRLEQWPFNAHPKQASPHY